MTWRSSAFSRHKSSWTDSSTTSSRSIVAPLIQDLRSFIVDNFLFGDESAPFGFSDDDSFQERGIVDSTGILELVCHLEEKYALTISDDELVPDNLDSLSKVARFIQGKRQLQPAVIAG